MSESDPTQVSTELPPSDAPPETTEAPAPRLRGSDLRYSDEDDVPTWARGKTSDEILATASDLYAALQRPQTTPLENPPSVSSPPVTTSSDLPTVDSNLIYSDPNEYHRQMERRTEALVEKRLANAERLVMTPMASMARTQAQANPKRKDVWERYAPEIEAIVARLPDAAKARPDIWDEAARMVAGEHLDDIAQARAEAIIARGRDSGSLGTQGGSPNEPISTPSPLRKLFEDRHIAVKGFISDDIPLSKVREHYTKMGYKTDEEIANLLTARVSA